MTARMPPAVRSARTAVAWVFAANGFAFASWASRLPALRDAFGLSPAGEIGRAHV